MNDYQEIRVTIRNRRIIIASKRSEDGSVVSIRVEIDDGTKRYVMEHAMSTYGGELWCDLSAISDIFRALSTRVLEGKL